MKPRNTTVYYSFVLCLLVLSCLACSSKDDYIGKYVSIDEHETLGKKNFIELMKSGQGAWKCCDEDGENEVSFTWSIKGRELRIYTKGGGVMIGELQKDSFVIDLPERKHLTFHKLTSESE